MRQAALAPWRVACHDPKVLRPRAHLRSLPTLALLGLTALAGCSNKPPAEVADRLWVAQMPTGPRSQIDAFVLTEVGKKNVGSFYHGSLYRGVHDSFMWTTKAKDSGVIHLLQEQRDVPVRTKPCKPDRGFDQCMLLEGDPKKVVRYQSRKRWAIPRRGKSMDVPALMIELSEEDDELQALVEAQYAE
jgi:hypothetical protein